MTYFHTRRGDILLVRFKFHVTPKCHILPEFFVGYSCVCSYVSMVINDNIYEPYFGKEGPNYAASGLFSDINH